MKVHLLISTAALVISAAVPAIAQIAPPVVQAPPQPAADSQLPVIDVTDESTQDMSILVPAMPTTQSVQTPAGDTATLGRQIAEVIAADLRNTGLFKPAGPDGVRAPGIGEVRAPDFTYWRNGSAQALVQGYVQAGAGGRLTVGCYLYDVALGLSLIHI